MSSLSVSTPSATPNGPPPTRAFEHRLARTKDFRLWGFFAAAILALVAGHSLAMDARTLLLASSSWLGAHAWIITVFSVAVMGGVLVRLYRDRLAHRLRLSDAVVVLLSSQWVCLGLHDVMHALHWPSVVPVVGGLAVFASASWGAFHLHHDLETARTLHRVRTADRVLKNPVRGLILFVSPPTTVPEVATADVARQPGGWAVRLAGDIDLPPDNLAAAIKEMSRYKPFHNWQQLLRSVLPIRETVKHVWLIGSPGKPPPDALTPHRKTAFADGSRIYLPLCRDFLRHYLRSEDTAIHGADEDAPPVDFEDFDELMKLLRLHRPKAMHGLRHAEVAVDVTAGIKIASIAGAVLTLKQETVIQYVQTIAGTDGTAAVPEAQIYDLRWDSPPSLGH